MAIPLILSQPRLVTQTMQTTCWRAAFVSWMEATGIRTSFTEQRLQELFGGINGALSADNSATERGIRIINQFGFMASEAVRGSRLTAQFLERKLQQGHIYLAFRPVNGNSGPGHVVVIYGVETNLVRVMNPDAMQGISTIPINFLASRQHAVVGVPNGIVRAYEPPIQNPFAGMSTTS